MAALDSDLRLDALLGLEPEKKKELDKRQLIE